MQQLSSLDATFLYAETPETPMHIGPLMIYDPSTTEGGFVRFKDILATFEKRLNRSPVFRRKLEFVPLGLDQPYWVEDESFDLEFHVRHIALPKPGDWRQLWIQVSRLHARAVDRSRPLWEAYIIEGLDNLEGLPPGCFAMFLKMHHAAIDGASGAEIMAAIHDLEPYPEQEPPPKALPRAEPPSRFDMLWRAYRANLRAPLGLVKLVTEGMPAWRRVQAGIKANKFKSLGDKERTRFNGPITPHRVCGAATYDLGEVRRLKGAVEGATVNDLILSLVGGAMRHYLQAAKELPGKSLVAGTPVNVRDAAEVGSAGNVVSMMTIPMRSDIADPVERLRAVHEAAISSKAYLNAVGARMMTDFTQYLPAELSALGWRAALASGLLADMKPIFNTIVTNVPGPQVPLYMGGAKVLRTIALGPTGPGAGLIHPVTSYNGQICISFQCCREMMPDPEVYERCLYQAFEELQRALPGEGTAAPEAAAGKAKTKAKAKARRKSSAGPRKAGQRKTAPKSSHGTP
jgi:diacylglycerol O-acyltransferase / wax synthase